MNEFKRMQKLAGIITESKYYESSMGEAKKSQKYPEGFSPFKTDKDDDEAYGGKVIAAYEAPMEGWDMEHYDSIVIVKKEDGFYVNGYISFGGFEEQGPFKTLQKAETAAYEEMEALKEDWESDEDEEDY